jgi:hypothetical protein
MFRSGRTHHAPVQSRSSETLSPIRSWAAYTIDMYGFEFSEATLAAPLFSPGLRSNKCAALLQTHAHANVCLCYRPLS